MILDKIANELELGKSQINIEVITKHTNIREKLLCWITAVDVVDGKLVIKADSKGIIK